ATSPACARHSAGLAGRNSSQIDAIVLLLRRRSASCPGGDWRQGPSCPAGRGKIAGRGETGWLARTQGGREPQRGSMPVRSTGEDSRPTEDNASRPVSPRSAPSSGRGVAALGPVPTFLNL